MASIATSYDAAAGDRNLISSAFRLRCRAVTQLRTPGAPRAEEAEGGKALKLDRCALTMPCLGCTSCFVSGLGEGAIHALKPGEASQANQALAKPFGYIRADFPINPVHCL